MGKMTIKLDGREKFSDILKTEIDAILCSFEIETQEKVNDVVRELADEGKEMLRKNSPKKTGKYAKGWTTSKKTWKRKTSIGNENYYSPIYVTKATIYNKNRPTLTHLLEHGHATRNGGHTNPQPHIQPVCDYLEEQFTERVKNKLEER